MFVGMTKEEARAVELTEGAWELAIMYCPPLRGQRHMKKDFVYEKCDHCNKLRMMFGVIFNEDNTTRCLWCK